MLQPSPNVPAGPAEPLAPVTLEHLAVKLEPLGMEHLEALTEVALDPSLWTMSASRMEGPDDIRAYVEAALESRESRTAMPLVTIHRADGRIVGSTRFANYSAVDRRVEIGWTWLARPYQRTALNTEAKYLMLRHAFEVMRLVRVELKTDVENERSRAAMLRLGAVEEGVLRRHTLLANGRWRDTIYYSILDHEWPTVRQHIEQLLTAPRTTSLGA